MDSTRKSMTCWLGSVVRTMSRAEEWVEEFFLGQKFGSLAHEYDPVAAREYYLRTRQLKGRKQGSSSTPESVRTAAEAEARADQKAQEVQTERTERREALKKQLKELEVKLEQLNKAIKRGKAEAMRKAGVSEETLNRMISQEVKSPGSSKGLGDKSNDGGSGSDSDSTPKTAQQKKKDAKAAKEAYEEETKNDPKNTNTGDDELDELQDKIDATTKKIAKLQEKTEALKRIGA